MFAPEGLDLLELAISDGYHDHKVGVELGQNRNVELGQNRNENHNLVVL